MNTVSFNGFPTYQTLASKITQNFWEFDFLVVDGLQKYKHRKFISSLGVLCLVVFYFP